MTEPTEDPIDAIAEAFLERFRRGERPPIEEFTQANPQFADRIRDLFPALVDLEVLGSGLGPVRRSVAPTRLGEYRIVREIGRGGMGVVYEAYQESLGRHVAVKVRKIAQASAQHDHIGIDQIDHMGKAAGEAGGVARQCCLSRLPMSVTGRVAVGRSGCMSDDLFSRELLSSNAKMVGRQARS